MASLYSLENKKIWVPGGTGMVGHALAERLSQEKAKILISGKSDLDLTNQSDVNDWMRSNKPDCIFLLAAKVGGIEANRTQPVDFIYNNLMIEANVIRAAWENKVEKLLFLGSSCTYPREAEQPIKEESLLQGPFEPTNQWYATAKLAGIRLCQAFREQYNVDFNVAMPTNSYGPFDHFGSKGSHVIPALIDKMHNAKVHNQESIEVWGSGAALREFFYVDDFADALIFLMKNYSSSEIINIGSGEEVSIKTLCELIKKTIDFKGNLVFDAEKPDGMPRKLQDNSKLFDLGWNPKTRLEEGLCETYQWYLENICIEKEIAYG